MSRYIDAEELKSAIRKAFPSLMMRFDINSIINEQPTADVVEVVRCKDCRYRFKNKWFCCDVRCLDADNYCNYGERREDE